MREFESSRDYRRFAESVMFRWRYRFEPHVDEFLHTIAETCRNRRRTFEAGEILWRAQLGNDWQSQPGDPDDPLGKQVQAPVPFAEARMKPPPESAKEGRINPKGIPCLYLANDADTAMAEMRPWVGSYVSLGRFKIVKPLQILDCSKAELSFPSIPFNPSDEFELDLPLMNAQERENAVWGEIGYALSEPATRSDLMAEYAPTQILAEVFRKHGCDGIRYKSLLGPGHSFALFDVNSAEISSRRLHKTTKVFCQFEEV